jgi:hypothetical protein
MVGGMIVFVAVALHILIGATARPRVRPEIADFAPEVLP